METSRVDGVKAPQHPNPGHWTTDFRLRHVLAQAPLDQILYALDLRPGVGARLALAGHGFVLLSALARRLLLFGSVVPQALFWLLALWSYFAARGVWQLAFRANLGSDDGAASSRQLRVHKPQAV